MSIAGVAERVAPARVLVAKLGLDGHDRGAKVVAFALRDAGCEVLYLGLRNTIAQVLSIAAQESVDVIGISTLSGAHVELGGQLLAERAAYGLEHVPVVLGGTIPMRDVAELKRRGAAAVFPTGSSIADVVAGVLALAAEHQQAIEATDDGR